jgi:RNA polymerase sigma factor (sigma-70 family)
MALTPDQEKELAAMAQAGDEEALESFFQANRGLALYVVQKMPQWAVESAMTRDDLIQEAYIALVHAIQTWKPKKRFATYAQKVIMGRVRRAVENGSQMIRIPVPVQEDIRKIKSAQSKLHQLLGREPSLTEVAQLLDEHTDWVKDRIVVSQRQPVSLDAYKRDNLSEESE